MIKTTLFLTLTLACASVQGMNSMEQNEAQNPTSLSQDFMKSVKYFRRMLEEEGSKVKGKRRTFQDTIEKNNSELTILKLRTDERIAKIKEVQQKKST